jgi:D-tyrosyl-tRNA(Tyr) deacylase
MIALVQRVTKASVETDDETVGAIGPGLLILLGVHEDDTEAEMHWTARKCAHLRIFPNEEGKMDRSVRDADVDNGGEVLVVPQFTLYGDVSRGHRPSFDEAAPPGLAERLYEDFLEAMEEHLDQPVAAGVFGATMDVQLVNDGPVTLWVEKRADAS